MVQAVTILYYNPVDNFDSYREFFAISSEGNLDRYLSGKNHANWTREGINLMEGEFLFEIAPYTLPNDRRERVVQFKPPVLPKTVPSEARLLLIRSPLEVIINRLEHMYGFPKDWSQIEMPEQARALLELAQQLDSANYGGASGSASN